MKRLLVVAGLLAAALVAVAFVVSHRGRRVSPAGTELSKAAAGGDAAAVKALLAGGAEVDARDNGYTPLMFAARAGSVEAINALIDAKADPNLRDCAAADGWTPLIHALHKRQNEAARALVERGADVNAREGGCRERMVEGGQTPLMYAAANDNAEMVKFLLERGANPRDDSRNENALTHALSGAALGKLSDIDRAGGENPCPVETVKALLAKAPDLKVNDGALDLATAYLLKRKCPELAGLLEGQRAAPPGGPAPPPPGAQN
jgi:hypothetical protein